MAGLPTRRPRPSAAACRGTAPRPSRAWSMPGRSSSARRTCTSSPSASRGTEAFFTAQPIGTRNPATAPDRRRQLERHGRRDRRAAGTERRARQRHRRLGPHSGRLSRAWRGSAHDRAVQPGRRRTDLPLARHRSCADGGRRRAPRRGHHRRADGGAASGVYRGYFFKDLDPDTKAVTDAAPLRRAGVTLVKLPAWRARTPRSASPSRSTRRTTTSRPTSRSTRRASASSRSRRRSRART